jgi:hypothetical protein
VKQIAGNYCRKNECNIKCKQTLKDAEYKKNKKNSAIREAK